MKILVLSDSHSALSFMYRCVQTIKPDAIIHLGDYFDDGQALHEAFPEIPCYQVPGNCDRYRCPPGQPEILVEQIGGVTLYLTHGHLHRVKSGTGGLLASARESGAAAVLYGHTHQADCRQEPDGLWVLNPGSCGDYGGSAGILELDGGSVVTCRILQAADLLLEASAKESRP